jgi:outer membrane protein
MLVRLLFASALAAYSVSVWAQSRSINVLDDRSAVSGDTEVERSSREDADPGRWRFALGAGFLAAPTYPGADSSRGTLVPLVQARKGNFFIGVGGVGYDLYKDSTWLFSASLSPSRGRKEADDPHLRGLGNIESTARANIQAGFARGVIQVKTQLSTDVAGNKQGTLARLDVQGRLPLSARSVLFAGPGVTWANDEYASSYFGVNATQSANSGLAQHGADSGVNSVRFTAGAIRKFGSNWLGVASLTLSKLRGDAANSPVTQDRTQNQFFAGAAYIF